MVVSFVLNNKAGIALGVIAFAFIISTIAVAVELANKQEELKNCLNSKDQNTISTTEDPAITTTESSGGVTPPPKVDYRLPGRVRPISYDLMLNPDLTAGDYEGVVNIKIEVINETTQIILHADRYLDIQAVSLKSSSEENVIIRNFYNDFQREFLIHDLSESLKRGDIYNLEILFSGNLTNGIVGFYRSSYITEDGSIKNIATSKFEPTYARQAFPCFDEPDMKANFTVTLVTPKEGGYHALSNMDEETSTPTEDNIVVKFKPSVKMSTYLACFIVSDFDKKDTEINSNGIGENFRMSVYATPAQLEKVTFALETGKKVVEYYIQYFKIPYPLPKLDMIAIPDFVSGAMEHWGLVTFRETSLLYEVGTSSTVNKQRVAEVIAHELAHMWFGNLVTMKWWNDLWLNEGFASYIEYKGVDTAYPKWGVFDQFVISDLHSVLKLDATLASHPIVQTVENPDQITALFDTITYSKGSSIIRMLEDFVGPEIFQQAVTNYLNNHKFDNAVTDDLLVEIDNLVKDGGIKEMMATWTQQMGLPVVQLTKISSTQYKLTQRRFLSNPNDYEKEYDDSAYNYRWTIPITYFTDQGGDIVRDVFDRNDLEKTIDVPASAKWVKLNRDQTAYYRINYTEDNWEALGLALNDNETFNQHFSVSDRAHLLNDVFALADAEQLNYDIALGLMSYLKHETEYVPWSVAASKLLFLKNMLYYTEDFSHFRTFSRDVVGAIYKDLSWTPSPADDDHMKNRLRIIILDLACSIGVPECLENVKVLFDGWLKSPEERPAPDIRNLVYKYGMESVVDEKDWNTVWELFLSEQDASEKSKLMFGLSAIQVPWILKRFIDLAWDETNVRGQDYFTCLQYIAANRVGETLVWDYVRENWGRLVDRFTLNERYLGSMIPGITSQFNSNLRLEEIEAFFQKYPEAGAGEASRRQALETIRSNIRWFEVNKKKVSEWLGKYEPISGI